MKKIKILIIALLIILAGTSIVFAVGTPSGTASTGNGGSVGGSSNGTVGGAKNVGSRTRYVYCWEDENGEIHEFDYRYHIVQGEHKTIRLKSPVSWSLKYVNTMQNSISTVWGDTFKDENYDKTWGIYKGGMKYVNLNGTALYGEDGEGKNLPKLFENNNTAIWFWRVDNRDGYIGNGVSYKIEGKEKKTPSSTIIITEKDSRLLLDLIKERATAKYNNSVKKIEESEETIKKYEKKTWKDAYKNAKSTKKNAENEKSIAEDTLDIIEKINSGEIISHIKIYAEMRNGTTGNRANWEARTGGLWDIVKKELYCEKPYYLERDPETRGKGYTEYKAGWDYVGGYIGTGNIQQYWKKEGTGEDISKMRRTKTEDGISYSKSRNDAEVDLSGYEFKKATLEIFSPGNEPTKETISQDPYTIIGTSGVMYKITYWYGESEPNMVDVYWKEEGTNKDLHTPVVGLKITGNTTYNSNLVDSTKYKHTKTTFDGVESKDKSVTVTKDNKSHSITFWYKAIQQNDITVRYVIVDEPGGTEIKELRTDKDTIIEGGQPKTYRYINPAFWGSTIEYTGKYKVDDQEIASGDSVVINFDSQNHTITFYYTYNAKIKVTVVAVNQDTMSPIKYIKNQVEVKIPTKQQNEKAPTIDYYEYQKKYEVRLDKGSAILNKGETIDDSSGKGYSYEYKEPDGAPSEILVIFYYKPKYHLNIKWIELAPKNLNGEGTTRDSRLNIPINSEEKIINSNLNSYNNEEKFLNIRYEIEDSAGNKIKEDDSMKYSVEPYNIIFKPTQDNYTIRIYYTTQLVDIIHKYESGLEIKKESDQKVPGTYSKLSDKVATKYELDAGEPKSMPSNGKVNVEVVSGKAKRELVIMYKEPSPTFDDSSLELGVFPNDLYNQYIGSPMSAKYTWVLDRNNHTLTIRMGDKDVSTIEDISHTLVIEFPFDVYANFGDGLKLYSAGEKINVNTLTENIGLSNKYGKDIKVFETTLNNIKVPVWVEEKEYIEGIKVTVTSDYGEDISEKEISAKVGVIVVGEVYDFSITNLIGQDLWTAQLFNSKITPANGEYEANNLPVGQKSQQEGLKLMSGIPLGSKIYFTLNTKGEKSKSISITPSFYWIPVGGGNPKKVNAYVNGKLLTTITTPLRKTNLDPANVNREIPANDRNAATNTYNHIDYTLDRDIGIYTKINIPESLRTPDTSEVSTNIVSIPGGIDINKYYSHWYADYMLPSDIKFVDGASYSESNILNTGHIVVYFSIKTLDSTQKDYLAYNKPSGVNKTVGNVNTMWEYERAGNNLTGSYSNSFTVPQITANATIGSSNLWITGKEANDSVAVLIYDLTHITNQNYDTVGTH